MPQLTLKGRVEMLTEHRASKFEAEDLTVDSLRAQLQSDTIKQQLRDRLTWALVNPIIQIGEPPFTTSTAKASINTKTGEITLKDAAVAGNVINFVGILNDPYLGQIIIPGCITVVAAPEPEPHTCDYEGYSIIEGNLSFHYRVCECGEKKTEPHKFTEFSSENGSQTVIKNVCPCGVAITEYAPPKQRYTFTRLSTPTTKTTTGRSVPTKNVLMNIPRHIRRTDLRQ